MSSRLVEPHVLRGAQRPRISWVPASASTTGPEAIDLAALAGLYLDDWQQYVLTEGLGERPDGKWAAFEVGLVVSRQNGKGGVLEARELAGLYLLGERLIIHSAHQFDTSIEHFRRLLGLIEETPALSKRVKRVSNAHGNEGIELKSGQRIRFRTRTKGGGRGFTSDCLVLDEAMDIPEATHGALLPTLSARPNPQVWYTGSAVDENIDDNGVVFARVRERGLACNSQSLAFFEWSPDIAIDDITPEVVSDPLVWAGSNPGLGIRIPEEHVAHEHASLSTRKFAVERLGIGAWPRTDDLSSQVITRDAWAACLDSESQMRDPVSFSVDVTPDRAFACIGAAGDRADGRPHVEVVEQHRGTGWVVTRIAELVKEHKTFGVFIDPGAAAGSLIPEISDVVGTNRAGESLLVPISAKEYAQACGVFFDSIIQEKLRHVEDTDLASAVDGARSRPLGQAWAWDRKNSDVDISALVACTLALFGNSTRPKRKARVVNLNNLG